MPHPEAHRPRIFVPLQAWFALGWVSGDTVAISAIKYHNDCNVYLFNWKTGGLKMVILNSFDQPTLS